MNGSGANNLDPCERDKWRLSDWIAYAKALLAPQNFDYEKADDE